MELGQEAAAAGPPDAGGGLTDEEVPGFCRGLGLPGLVDVHVHFMPERVLRKVWAYFDSIPAAAGLAWPIHYRYEQQVRLAVLRRLGVLAHTALVYPCCTTTDGGCSASPATGPGRTDRERAGPPPRRRWCLLAEGGGGPVRAEPAAPVGTAAAPVAGWPTAGASTGCRRRRCG
jgi:hypothetical protein